MALNKERNAENCMIEFYCPSDGHYSKGKTLSWEFVQIVTCDGWEIAEVGRFIQRYVTLLEILARQAGQNEIGRAHV